MKPKIFIALLLGLVMLFAIEPTTKSVASMADYQTAVVLQTAADGAVLASDVVTMPEVTALITLSDAEYMRVTDRVKCAGFFVSSAYASDDVASVDDSTGDASQSTSIFTWIKNNSEVLLALALAISEILAQIPSIKANSIFQLFFSWLKSKKTT